MVLGERGLKDDLEVGVEVRFKITWWIHGAGEISRGHDIVDVSEDFDEDDVEKLIENDLDRNLGDMTTKYGFPSPFEPNLPVFHKKHLDLMMADKHSEVSNWGVLRIVPLKEKQNK